MMPGYLGLKALHVIGAVLMVGNVTVTGIWAAYLYRHRHQVPFRAIARAILWTDLLFTFGGGALLTISGILMVKTGQLAWRDTPWVRTGIVMLALSSLAWLVFLLPDQFRMERVDPADDARVRQLFTRWSVIGWASTVVLYVGIWAMTTKAGW
jgi:uncharacterized membrane protein